MKVLLSFRRTAFPHDSPNVLLVIPLKISVTCCFRFGLVEQAGIEGEAIFEPLDHGMNRGLQFDHATSFLDASGVLKDDRMGV